MVTTSQRKKLFVLLLPLSQRKHLTVPVKSESAFTRNAAYFFLTGLFDNGQVTVYQRFD